MTPEPLDDYVERASALLGLPLAPAYRAGVLEHFAVMCRMAALVRGVPLPDDAELAARFVP